MSAVFSCRWFSVVVVFTSGSRGNNGAGELLKAFHSAYTAFLRNKAYPRVRKSIANYDVSFTETPETIVVFLSPRRKPGERPLMGGATSLGMALGVVLSKAEYRVIEMKGFK